MVNLCRIARRQKLTDVVQALCAVGLLILGVVGYVFTVQPAFRRDLLQENVDKLTAAMNRYNATSVPYVIGQFLAKVRADADKYRCSPTVYDLGADNRNPPPAMTGQKLIKENMQNPEFQLLDGDRRTLLVDQINNFVDYQYPDRSAFTTELEIQHKLHMTGPLAVGDLKLQPIIFRFSPQESERSTQNFGRFDQAMSTLRAVILPDAKTPVLSPRSCVNTGTYPPFEKH
jgi:hypothetical protein